MKNKSNPQTNGAFGEDLFASFQARKKIFFDFGFGNSPGLEVHPRYFHEQNQLRKNSISHLRAPSAIVPADQRHGIAGLHAKKTRPKKEATLKQIMAIILRYLLHPESWYLPCPLKKWVDLTMRQYVLIQQRELCIRQKIGVIA